MLAPPPATGQGIAARDVTVTYRNGHTALRHASFEIPQGQRVALVGESGGGKSTIAHLLMGLYPVTGGRIEVFGQDVAELDLAEELAALAGPLGPLVRRGVAMAERASGLSLHREDLMNGAHP